MENYNTLFLMGIAVGSILTLCVQFLIRMYKNLNEGKEL